LTVRLKPPTTSVSEPDRWHRIYNSLMRDALGRFLTAALVVTTTLSPKFQSPVVTPPASDGSVYLGILDDAREELGREKTVVVRRRLVMPAFEKRNAEWQPVTHFWPHRMKWTVAFDGKNLGEIESQASTIEADQINSNSSRAKQLIVTASGEGPMVGKPSREFAGISSLFGLTAVRRPLVVVSKPFYRDQANAVA
jgi:hypothetical protein